MRPLLLEQLSHNVYTDVPCLRNHYSGHFS